MIAKTRKSTLAAATVVALTLTGLGVSAIAATSAQNNAATGYVVCVSKTTGEMKLRTKSTCPKGFTTKVFGAKGPAGVAGAQGAQGQAGPAGAQGLKGDIGEQGAQGPAGLPGLDGPQGTQGEVGPVGEPGPKGDIGEQGIQGEQGAPGLDGSAASVFTGMVSRWGPSLALVNRPAEEFVMVVTDKVLPAGMYLVTATTGFRGDTYEDEVGATTCWIGKVGMPLTQFAGQESYGGSAVMLQTVMEGGTKVSLNCAKFAPGGLLPPYEWKSYYPTITALKIGSVNP